MPSEVYRQAYVYCFAWELCYCAGQQQDPSSSNIALPALHGAMLLCRTTASILPRVSSCQCCFITLPGAALV